MTRGGGKARRLRKKKEGWRVGRDISAGAKWWPTNSVWFRIQAFHRHLLQLWLVEAVNSKKVKDRVRGDVFFSF
jgi:hypothetical protein